METLIKVELEEIAHLTADERDAVRAASGMPRTWSLEEAASALRGWFPDWFVFTGGHHVALHVSRVDSRRILLVAEGGAR